MIPGWRQTELGTVLTLQRGFDLPIQERREGTVPVVSSSGITGTHSKAMVAAPGVITGRYGTIGEIFFVREDFWPLNTTLFVKDFKGNDARFVYYLLKIIDFASCSDKSSVPGVNRNHLHSLRVSVPESTSEQRAIANILGTLDDKIELNRRMNETLETMAQAIFKSFLLDLHSRPRGWESRRLYDCATYTNGAVFTSEDFCEQKQGLPVIKIGELKFGLTDQTKHTSRSLEARYRIRSGDILFSWSGSPDTSIDIFLWTNGDGWLNQHIFKVEPALPEARLYVYYLLRSLKPTFVEIARNKQTTGLGHVTAEDLKRLETAFPSVEMLREFNRIVEPIHAKSFRNCIESQELALIRDALLPKLISGKVRVTAVNKLVETTA